MLLLRIAAKKGERKHKEEKLEEEYYKETEKYKPFTRRKRIY